MSLLGIHVGTTSCRAIAVALDGTVLGRAFSGYSVSEGPDGARELDVREVWAAVRDVIRKVAQQTREDPIRALSVTTMGEAITPLSAEGQILDRCILGSDPRGADYVEEIERQVGLGFLFDRTGRIPSRAHSMGKLCWIRDHRPRLFQSTWRFVLGSGLVAHLLGGSTTCDYSLAGGTLVYDINQKRWSHQVLGACNLPAFKLPDLAPAGKAIGTVAPGTARDIGLPANVQLILGGHDFCCSALGAGVIDSGMAVYNIGSSMHLAPVFQAIPLTSLMLQCGLTMEAHVVPERFLSHVYNRAGGQVLRWFRDKLAPLEKREAKRRGSNVYTTLLAEMPDEPTRMMVLPQAAESGAPHYDSRNFGAALGFDLRATRGEVIKALLEGITYPFLEGRALFEQVGMRMQVCRAMGGGARSDPWLQLSADILGIPVERNAMVDPGPLGAAIVAGVGSEAYAGYSEAVDALVRVLERFEPDATRHDAYRNKLARYRELYPLSLDD